MSQHFYVHPDNPQVRLISQAVQILQNGGVIVYPTDSGYALGCQMGNKDALERICRIRRIEPNHDFTLIYVVAEAASPRHMRSSDAGCLRQNLIQL